MDLMQVFFKSYKRKIKKVVYLGSPCFCFSCNFDSVSKTCTGRCNAYVASSPGKCVSNVANPSSDSDCGCFNCQATSDDNGKVTCSGEPCGATGKTCQKVTQSYAFADVNTCQCR
jgi:hypothetical protein